MTTHPSNHLVTVRAPYDSVWRTVNDVALWPAYLDKDVTIRLRRRTADGDEFEVITSSGSWVIIQRPDYPGQRTWLRRLVGDADAGAGDQLTFREVADGVEVRWDRDGAGCGLRVPLGRLAVPAAAGAAPAGAGDPLQVARALATDIAAYSVDAARASTLPAELVSRMRAGGLYGLGLPLALGGSQSDFHTIVSTVEELSRADGAVGWQVLIGNTNAFLAWLEPTVAKELIGGAASTSLAGSTAPAGQAEVDGEDRLRVSGRWPFCSGCLHADLLMVGFRLPEQLARNDRRPDARVGFFRAGVATVLGTWRTLGLEGTGSHDIELDGLLIPGEHTAALYYEPARQDGELYRLTPYNILMVLLAGFPLGVARRAIDEVTELARSKNRVGSRTPLIEDPEVITGLLSAESALRAARSLVFDTFGEAWQILATGADLSAPQRAGIAMTTSHALRCAREITTAMFRITGAGGLRLDHPLQRCLRDIHVAGQHFGFSDDLRLRYGRTFLGLDSGPALYQV